MGSYKLDTGGFHHFKNTTYKLNNSQNNWLHGWRDSGQVLWTRTSENNQEVFRIKNIV